MSVLAAVQLGYTYCAKWPPAITRLTAHFTCGVPSDLVIAGIEKEYGPM